MSITLFCLVKGNTTANAFEVDIEKDKSISHLKKVIKAEKQNDFAGVDADKLRLWKVPISDDHVDPLSNLSLQDSDELLAIRKFSKYFPNSPPEEHIYVLVSPPETTATSSREQELLDRIASLEEALNKSNNTGIQMVASACSDRIRDLSSSLGQLLRVDTLESIAWDEKKPCHLVLPDDRPKIRKNEDNSSMWQVSASDEKNEIHGYRNNFHMVVETFMNPNRCYIANSLGYKLHDKDQEDYISYIKEEFTGYIKEVNRYGFDHIIIIGELHYGMLFLDCFGRVFNLDGMTDALWFLGDYFKGVERVAKGLATDRVPWILRPDVGTIEEIKNAPLEHYTFPVEKKRKKKKSSRKKHH